MPGEPGIVVIGKRDGIRPCVHHAEHAAVTELAFQLILEAVVVSGIEWPVHRDVRGPLPLHPQYAADPGSLTRVRIVLLYLRRLPDPARAHIGTGEVKAGAQVTLD